MGVGYQHDEPIAKNLNQVERILRKLDVRISVSCIFI